ncbi:hypothetical protein DICA3_C16974 [Diutina catenulata]
MANCTWTTQTLGLSFRSSSPLFARVRCHPTRAYTCRCRWTQQSLASWRGTKHARCTGSMR